MKQLLTHYIQNITLSLNAATDQSDNLINIINNEIIIGKHNE